MTTTTTAQITMSQYDETADAILGQTLHRPTIGLILGSGLSPLADAVENATVLPYEEVPNFPVSTVAGHAGRLVIGQLAGVTVCVMQGRFHAYEGYSLQQTTLPVRVIFPDGRVLGSGGTDAPTMRMVRPAAVFARLGADAKIGFGEAYMTGDWTTGPGTDLADLLAPFAARMSRLVHPLLQRLRHVVERTQPAHEENTPENSRGNIARHYDLSN